MPAYICVTCGVQHAPNEQPPEHCAICEDERQYVGWKGQQWTTLEQMAAAGYHNVLREEEPGLISIGTTPSFAIGQRALLVRTPGGNVLWDCQSFIDSATITAVQELGGVHAIAISHPHFYGVNIEWSEAFGGAPVYIHEADREWVMRPHPNVVLWHGETTTPLPGLTLIRLGGHFDGAQVLHWPGGAGGQGAVLCGDTIQVVQDRRWVSFMYSYPNLIPLPPSTVRHIVETMRPYRFDRLYGAWNGRVVVADGFAAVERSAERYIRWSTGNEQRATSNEAGLRPGSNEQRATSNGQRVRTMPRRAHSPIVWSEVRPARRRPGSARCRLVARCSLLVASHPREGTPTRAVHCH